ncbi:MAG: hypothetical protein OIF50_04845, partial [Flavobacteriaceae bacterium]|nr:hypothetical protein [Flavobacteriaceae bacterium]
MNEAGCLEEKRRKYPENIFSFTRCARLAFSSRSWVFLAKNNISKNNVDQISFFFPQMGMLLYASTLDIINFSFPSHRFFAPMMDLITCQTRCFFH